MVECSQSFSVFMASHSSCLVGVGVAVLVQAQVIVIPSPQSQVLAPVESWVAGVGVAMPVQAQVIVIPLPQSQGLAPIGPWATWSKDGWSLQTLVDLLQWHPSMVECSQSFSVFMASHSSCLVGVGVVEELWLPCDPDGWSLQTLVDLLQWHPSMVECSQSFSVFM